MKKIDNKKGISLIVLVITIIVIIILAVAVILSISNNNPIENARKARFLNDLKTIQEEVTLHIANEYANRYDTYDPSTDTGINDILEKYPDYKDKIQVVNGKVTLIDNENVSDQEKEWAMENGVEVKKETEKEVSPTIPVGFKYKEGTVDTGYVIVNETDGNEFVWVPVNNMTEFKREDGYYNGTLQTDVSSGKATEPLDYSGTKASQSEVDEYNAMKSSVEKYKGFYIGRYEASDNGSGVAQSKKDKTPWLGISWGNSVTDLSGGSVEKARAVYSNSDKAEGSKYPVSTLPYGVQWDVIVRWLERTYSGILQNSSNYGNYALTITDDNNYINTGSNEKYVTNNIYDLCGNAYEWTMEAYSSDHRIYRGGMWLTIGTDNPVSSRCYDTDPADGYDGYYGFRLALYIK